MKKASVKQLREELREIKRRLRSIERQVNHLEVGQGLSPREEFKRAFPDVKIDPQWFKVVGSLPPSPVEEDGSELSRIVEERYTR